MKYNLSYMKQFDEPLTGLLVEVNQATNGWVIYLILLAIFIIMTYVFIRRTNDIGKSLLSASYVTSLPMLILFYFGKTIGYPFIPEIVMYSVLIIIAVSLGITYYARNHLNQ